MKRWGYREVVTPIFEFLDVISKGVSQDLIEQGYKLTDRQSGRVMIIRPDVTPQIARLATTSLKDIRPLRLSYALDVFRYEDSYGGRQREMLQLGAELIGVGSPEGDVEVLLLLADILDEVGLEEYRFIVSHSDFLKGIINDCPEPVREDIVEIIKKKNLSRLEELYHARFISKRLYSKLQRVLFLFGDKEVLKEAKSLCSNELSSQAIAMLQKFYKTFKKEPLASRILFDLSEAEGLQYHSGIVFQVMDFDKNLNLGFGGRYDRMLRLFGLSDDTATGFSLDAQALLEASKLSVRTKKKTILYSGPIFNSLINGLRKRGYRVVYSYRKDRESLHKEAVRVCADHVLIGRPRGVYEIVFLPEGESRKVAEKEIFNIYEEVI